MRAKWMPVETRYMRSDKQTVNGVTAFILGLATSGTGIYQKNSQVDVNPLNAYLGVRVYVLHADGTKTELTSGVSAVVSLPAATTPQAVSANWSCPQTILAPTDAIYVEVYGRFEGYDWTIASAFVSEQLNTSILNAATWTVTYYGYRVATYRAITDDYSNDLYFYWDGSYPSRIENFKWGILPIVSMPKLVKCGALPLHTIFVS
jgi:hypothetical protein